MQEGKLLGHIVSIEGIKIDQERVKAILKISIPRNKKGMESFLGKINFLRWFIPNFAEIIKPIIEMLKKDKEVKWSAEARSSFERIKHALGESLALISPYFSKKFLPFSFAYENTLASFPLQKNSEGMEQPISLFNKTIRYSKIKYSTIEKQAYALVQALNFFRIYPLHSKIIAYVPNVAVEVVLV